MTAADNVFQEGIYKRDDNMGNELQNELVEALVNDELDNKDSSIDTLARNVLVATLEMDKNVFDSMNFGTSKRGRGRPRKGEVDGEIEALRVKGMKRMLGMYSIDNPIKEQAKEKLRNRDRLNPQPTKALERELDLSRELREIGWDIGDLPSCKDELKTLRYDLNNLRKEAGLKRLDDTYGPYREFCGKIESYEEAKEHVTLLLNQSALSLKRGNFDEVEMMLPTLKKKPQELLSKYNEIINAYDRCCDALSKDIERIMPDKVKGDPTVLDAERNGYGMIRGETSEEYQKRMRSIGRGKEIADTIRGIDELVEQTERRWRSVAGIGIDKFEIVKDNFRNTINSMLRACSIATNHTIDGINAVLEGHLKSAYEEQEEMRGVGERGVNKTFILGEAYKDGGRYGFTQKCFGVDKGLKTSKYEKHGCLHTLSPSESDSRIGGQYGANVIRWKPHYSVVTMTFTDSISLAREGLNYISPCLLTSPSPCCFNPGNRAVLARLIDKPINLGLEEICYMMKVPYCELQLHGEDQYNAEAIESISFCTTEDVRNLTGRAIEIINEKRIPIFVGGERIQIDSGGNIKEGK